MRLRVAIAVALAALICTPSAGAAFDLTDALLIGTPGLTALPLEETHLHGQVEGTVAMDFHGSSSAGCAAMGVCGVSGVIAWEPGYGADVTIVKYVERGKRRLLGSLSFTAGNGPITTAKVTGPTGAVCSDASSDDAATLRLGATPKSAFQIRLVDSTQSDFFATHCPGPTAADISGLLPVRTLPHALLHGHSRTIDLSAMRSFNTAGFAGTLRSTVQLRLSPDTRSSSLGVSEPDVERVREHLLQVDYGVASVSGGLSADLRGDPSSLCVNLDTCGTLGTLNVSPGASSGTFRMSAVTFGRASRGQLLNAVGLRDGRRAKGVFTSGYGIWSSPQGALQTTLSRADGGATCTDAVPLRHGLVLGSVFQGRFVLSYEAFPGSGMPLHTHCAGPLLSEVGHDSQLAYGSVPLSAMRHRTVTVHLNAGARVQTVDGYTISSRPDLRITLRRARVRERVFRG